MFKKLLKHISIAWIFLILTLSQQYLFYYFQEIPIVWLSFGKYLGFFAFFLSATFIKPFLVRYFYLSLIFTLNFFQMAHLSYYGTQILPNELILLFTQIHEIQGTLAVESHHFFIPLIFTLIPTSLGLYALKKSKIPYGSPILGILFTLYFIYNPVRTFITGNTWGRQPSTRELSGMNVYLSTSYFLGKILPAKLMKTSPEVTTNSSTELSFTKHESPTWDKVIVVLGESLTPHHMSLFGYKKPTTPYLESLKNDPRFFYTTGLSGGVSTDIAVAFFLNLGFGEAGSLKTARGNHCLFRLAKENKFSTYFFSTQSSEQLRYIAPYLCSSSLSELKSLEDISPETTDHQAAFDQDLFRPFSKIFSSDERQFIILHQRGSHAPWELRSRKEAQIFPHHEKTNHYDNSVVEFDLFMKKLDTMVSGSKKKILTIYVSDHGESLGVNGEWGHGRLNYPSFEVPVLIHAFNADLPLNTRALPKFIPHYSLALYISEALGQKPNQSPTDLPKDYTIYGPDIDGFAGKAKILFRPDHTYDFKVID